MIKSRKEILIINFIALTSSIISYIFTILMLMSFAETLLDKVLYLFCGVIIDGVKWFTLITCIKYYQCKLLKNFISYLALFVLFFTMSMIASISFSIYTVKKQMYDIEIQTNNNYVELEEQINNMKVNITDLQSEKNNELARLNFELDGLSLDYITRRQELASKKIELINFYDSKLETANSELDQKIIALNNIDNPVVEIKTLKNNAITDFFATFSNIFQIDIDIVIVTFALFLGVLLDTASICLTFDSAFTFSSKREFKKNITKNRHMRVLHKELNDVEITEPKIINFDDFVRYIQTNNIDIQTSTYTEFKDIMRKSNYFNYRNKYMKTLLNQLKAKTF